MRRAYIENRHVESRALAELLQVQFAWRYSGIEDPTNPANLHVGNSVRMPVHVSGILLAQQQVDLGWIYQSLAHLILFQPPHAITAEEGFEHNVVEDWVAGQSKYFQNSSLEAERMRIYS